LGNIRYTIDAACASSLYVMELASYYLNTGQAKMMLAGAVCCPERLQVLHGFNVLQAFPSQGNSTPLDQSSEGLKFGEGAGIFALKRLCDAERDGDRIYAVIESVGLANDGAGKHILSPSQKGQYLALERAYGDAPLADYIECHATGTPLGDRTELNTLEKFFQAKQSVSKLGANKAHLGHLLTASGMVSLIKSIQAIKHGIIPPTIGIDQAITSEGGVISSEDIVQSPTTWKENHQPKRIGINAFGFGAGGTGVDFNLFLALDDFIASSFSSVTLLLILMSLVLELAFTIFEFPISGAGASLLFGAISPAPVSLLPKFTSIKLGSGGMMVGAAWFQLKIKNILFQFLIRIEYKNCEGEYCIHL
jgi:3-oxoacyl-(acyl-carrier-protein) synthase